MKEQEDFSTYICGIPCGVVIDSYYYQAPSMKCAALCDTPDEYYGSEEFEWHLVDRKGYYARWLENKMSDSDKQDLEVEIIEFKRR